MSVNTIKDITITSIETITVFDPTTGDYMFTMDELQRASINQTQEKNEITGKQGRKLSSLKRNKGVTISGTNGLVSHGLLELQTGGQFTTKNTEVMWVDYLTVGASNKATTTYKAIGTAGSEILECYVKTADGTLGTKLAQVTSSVTTGKFTYTAGTKELQFHTDITSGTEIVVYYKRLINASVLEDISDHYSKKATLYIDAMGEDTCSNVYRIQFFVPRADFNGEFTFEMGNDQTVHEFEAEALSGSCNEAGKYFTYTVFGANAEDATNQ